MHYLDNNATTPPAPEALRAYMEASQQAWGNPASLHAGGRRALEELEGCRIVVADLLNCRDKEVVFTAGATESDNAAIHSAMQCHPSRRHIIVSAFEHDAVLKVAAAYEAAGYLVTRVNPEPNGQIAPERIAAACAIAPPCLIAVMAANNETGVVNDVYAIGRVAKSVGADYLVDATQALGKIPLDFDAMQADYLAASAHKIHGVKGVGLLVLRKSCQFKPLLLGGAQESERRAGTPNVPGVAAFAAALELCSEPDAAVAAAEVRGLRDALEQHIMRRFRGMVMILGQHGPRIWNTLYVCFRGALNRSVQQFLDARDVCVGVGSACSCLKNPKPSKTIVALNVPKDFQQGAIRFSFNRYHAPSLGGNPELLDDVCSALDEFAQAYDLPVQAPSALTPA